MSSKNLFAVKGEASSASESVGQKRSNEIERLEATFTSLSDAFSVNTLRAYRSDIKEFVGWCEKNDLDAFPAVPEAVAAFIEEEALHYKVATLSRRIAAISKAQRLLGFGSISEAPAVDLALRRCRRRLGTRQRQAMGLTAAKIDQIKSVLGWSLCDIRDRLLLALGYETLCRRSELVALSMEHIERYPTGEGSILVVRSKADPFGAGRRAYLSHDTLELLDRWHEASGIQDGPILRSFSISISNSEAAFEKGGISGNSFDGDFRSFS